MAKNNFGRVYRYDQKEALLGVGKGHEKSSTELSILCQEIRLGTHDPLGGNSVEYW